MHSLLEELNQRREEVLAALRFEGCRRHEMWWIDNRLVVRREDIRGEVLGTFAERKAQPGFAIYDLLELLVTECLQQGRILAEGQAASLLAGRAPETQFILDR